MTRNNIRDEIETACQYLDKSTDEFDGYNVQEWYMMLDLLASSTRPILMEPDLPLRREKLVLLAAWAIQAIEAQERVGIVKGVETKQ